VTDWGTLLEREKLRYRDGVGRVPDEPDARQKQLVRLANAAAAAGLACLMSGRRAEASSWLSEAAERYRASYAGAPPDSFGRLIGAVKMRLLAGDEEGAREDARWALSEAHGSSGSPIGRYAAALAELVLGEDAGAARIAAGLRQEPEDRFPHAVADALAGLALGDPGLYRSGLEATLRSFETRDAYLEDVPVADTVLALEALAENRGLAVHPASPLLPRRGSGQG
jgi:hypothetical protein